MIVQLLATCRDPSLLRMTTLVFETFRIGFPTARLKVTGNALPDFAREELQDLQPKIPFEFSNEEETVHHKWILNLILTESQPFWILDTDVIFYEPVESWKFDGPMAGYRIPEWQDEYTGCITRARLHPSLLWINPVKVRAEMAEFQPDIPTQDFANTNLLSPIVTALTGRKYFHDTVSLLYHAIGGDSFTDVQKNAFFHFHFGCSPDLVLPRLSNSAKVAEARHHILAHPEAGRGKWRDIEAAYANRNFTCQGSNVVTPISEVQLLIASKASRDICLGNSDALEFSNYYYHYCHGVDDLIDSMRDGRPLMHQEQIINLFFLAARIYNHRFFVAHRDLLYPIALQTTNTYADSVAWEKSPKPHLRAMGDVFRTCGNEMYVMIALICGGEPHMRKVSQWIKERDWQLQHDEHGNPI